MSGIETCPECGGEVYCGHCGVEYDPPVDPRVAAHDALAARLDAVRDHCDYFIAAAERHKARGGTHVGVFSMGELAAEIRALLDGDGEAAE